MSVEVADGSIAGFLVISVPTGTVSLGSLVNTVGGAAITGSLGQVQISDTRRPSELGWTASVNSTVLSPTLGGTTIAASAIGYTAGAITQTGTATFAGHIQTDLRTAKAAVTATAINGDNSATWNPTITVNVPGGMAAGVYTGTIIHSVM